ncbi:TetR/AcrR family transcriptional regulator [Rathayibacter caricis DSM 15933]|uniref:TetR/AcrR family transcriptional regulator n=1 Tax=Rathayibacter caricis DSM 15933 TaxID=1328867 RepID=A0A2T4UQY5_9MICO|nr:TetR/AcrR family transcriptional regulator [Rathayibacter caricis]PTL71923.1 TetR/AcrR family transcriptional regulator [Rathayibacter caricis DSM 15933]
MTVHEDRATKPRGPYKNGLKRRREIVEAATVVFGQYGYHGGSLRTIAEMVGTTPATLVSYFTSKELLLVAVLEHWNVVSSQSEGEQGLDYFRANIPLMRYHVAHPGLIQLFLTMSTEATQEDHPARSFIRARQQRTHRIMLRELQRVVDDGTIAPLPPELIEREVRLMIGVLDGVELGWLTDSGIDLEGVVRHHIDEAIARWSGRTVAVVREETDAYLARRVVRAPGAVARS